jgi:hypothetical protein
MRIECYENEQLVREMVAEELVVDPPFQSGDFDVDMLRDRYRDAEDTADADSEGKSDIQKALDDFKKRYE